MCMSPPAIVDVDVDQLGDTGVVDRAGEGDLEARLLPALPQCRIPGGLAGIDVPARLQPDPETLVLEQHHATRPDHDARPRHVDRIGVEVEWSSQRVERRQEPLDRDRLAFVDRSTSSDIGSDPSMELVAAHSPDLAAHLQITSL